MGRKEVIVRSFIDASADQKTQNFNLQLKKSRLIMSLTVTLHDGSMAPRDLASKIYEAIQTASQQHPDALRALALKCWAPDAFDNLSSAVGAALLPLRSCELLDQQNNIKSSTIKRIAKNALDRTLSPDIRLQLPYVETKDK